MKENKIPLYLNCSLVAELHMAALHESDLYEGIDLEYGDREIDVAFNPTHQRGIDTRVEANPTIKNIAVPAVKIQDGVIPVYSVLRRTPMDVEAGPADGNPLVYVFKGERKYKFKSDYDKAAIQHCIDIVLKKFAERYFQAIGGNHATAIICPSENALNTTFVKAFVKASKTIGKNVALHDEYLVKYLVDDIRYEVIDDPASSLNRWLLSLPKRIARRKRQILDDALNRMDREHSGVFAYHYIRDQKIRQHISNTMKLTPTFKGIDCKDIIVLDDTMTNGKTVSETCSLLCGSYLPKTITALTLFSPLK